jgi:hypothetical protein
MKAYEEKRKELAALQALVEEAGQWEPGLADGGGNGVREALDALEKENARASSFHVSLRGAYGTKPGEEPGQGSVDVINTSHAVEFAHVGGADTDGLRAMILAGSAIALITDVMETAGASEKNVFTERVLRLVSRPRAAKKKALN